MLLSKTHPIHFQWEGQNFKLLMHFGQLYAYTMDFKNITTIIFYLFET